jgi:Cyclin-dependent kinase inhibitor 3 (CDKN3)
MRRQSRSQVNPNDLNRPLPNSYWVIPRRLLAGEYPIGADYTDARARLAQFREAGVNYFIDLTESGELPPYRHLLPIQTKYQNSPIADTGVPQSVTQMQGLLSDLRAAVNSKHCTYVHCRAGIGRTSLVVGCYLADQSSDGNAALIELNRLWLQSERAKSWPKVPQTAQQADYIRRWPTLEGGAR